MDNRGRKTTLGNLISVFRERRDSLIRDVKNKLEKEAKIPPDANWKDDYQYKQSSAFLPSGREVITVELWRRIGHERIILGTDVNASVYGGEEDDELARLMSSKKK